MVGEPKQYLSLEEIAELLSVNYQLVYRLVRTGELPAARIGRIYRVSRQDLEAYMQRSKEQARGIRCGACGRTYYSRLTAAQVCAEPDCEQPICNDCWVRQGIRRCSVHRETPETT